MRYSAQLACVDSAANPPWNVHPHTYMSASFKPRVSCSMDTAFYRALSVLARVLCLERTHPLEGDREPYVVFGNLACASPELALNGLNRDEGGRRGGSPGRGKLPEYPRTNL